MISVRRILIALALAFTAYLAARGLWWILPVPRPLVMIAALSLYLVTTWLCLFWERTSGKSGSTVAGSDAGHVGDVVDDPRRPGRRGPTPLPAWAVVLALATAAIVPSAVSLAVGAGSLKAPFATWYLGGIGALMLIVMIRRRPWAAWTGIAFLCVSSMLWLGPFPALELGLVGSVVWVAVAQLMLLSMDRAARDTAELAQLQRAASVWQAAQSGRRRERRIQVQRAYAVAGPVLSRAVAVGGELDESERLQARLAEGRLRDELRGRSLLDDDVRAQLDDARERGASVTVLDEGGLDGVDADALAAIRSDLADTLRAARSDRLYIRTSPHETIAVTVVGRSGTTQAPSDEDAVDLWREIPHPAD